MEAVPVLLPAALVVGGFIVAAGILLRTSRGLESSSGWWQGPSSQMTLTVIRNGQQVTLRVDVEDASSIQALTDVLGPLPPDPSAPMGAPEAAK